MINPEVIAVAKRLVEEATVEKNHVEVAAVVVARGSVVGGAVPSRAHLIHRLRALLFEPPEEARVDRLAVPRAPVENRCRAGRRSSG